MMSVSKIKYNLRKLWVRLNTAPSKKPNPGKIRKRKMNIASSRETKREEPKRTIPKPAVQANADTKEFQAVDKTAFHEFDPKALNTDFFDSQKLTEEERVERSYLKALNTEEILETALLRAYGETVRNLYKYQHPSVNKVLDLYTFTSLETTGLEYACGIIHTYHLYSEKKIPEQTECPITLINHAKALEYVHMVLLIQDQEPKKRELYSKTLKADSLSAKITIENLEKKGLRFTELSYDLNVPSIEQRTYAKDKLINLFNKGKLFKEKRKIF